MTKTKLRQMLLLCCFLAYSGALFSQEEETPDPTLQKLAQIIVQIGIGSNSSASPAGFTSLSIERPLSLYHHVGLQFNRLTPDYNIYSSYYNRPAKKGSYEISAFSKYFLHGRLTGRKSTIYFGPEISYGVRKVHVKSEPYYDPQIDIKFKEKTTQFLLRWGVQYKIGAAIVEINLPIGIESVKSPYQRNFFITEVSSTSYRFNRLVLIPGFHMGIAL